MDESVPPSFDAPSVFEALPRSLAQILLVIIVSAGLVLVVNSLGARDTTETRGPAPVSDQVPSTTVRVAQLPPTPPAAAISPDGTRATTTSGADEASTTARGPGATSPTGAVASGQLPPRIARVSASDVRPDSTDDCGAPTSYQPILAVDSVRATAWMAPGDGVGTVLTIDLAEPSVVSEVGLVPGYDKSDTCSGTDRFDELRRVTAVRWTFDDGFSVDQQLSPTPDLQTISLDPPVTTSRAEMTILATTEPGIDRLDHTPVSEVVVR